jgi:hypothetical protein
MGKLHIVDLAGSERLSLSGSSGSALTETQNINLSLATLGDVLSALSTMTPIQCGGGSGISSQQPADSAGEGGVVPYRNSKLTYLLKDSLGGNAKTMMIATVRTPARYRQQTLMTLLYASRAKKIKNHARINTDTAGDSKSAALVAEVERLRAHLRQREAEVDALTRQLPGGDGTVFGSSFDADMHDQRMRRVSMLSRENEQERLRLADCLRHVVHSHKSTLAVAERKYALLENKLGEYRGLFERQREEIEALRSALRRLSAGATEAEVLQMRALVERLARALQQARQEARDRALALTRCGDEVAAAREEADAAHAAVARSRAEAVHAATEAAAEAGADREALASLQQRYDALKRASAEALLEVDEAARSEAALRAELELAREQAVVALDQAKQARACLLLEREQGRAEREDEGELRFASAREHEQAEAGAAQATGGSCQACHRLAARYDALVLSLETDVHELVAAKDRELAAARAAARAADDALAAARRDNDARAAVTDKAAAAASAELAELRAALVVARHGADDALAEAERLRGAAVVSEAALRVATARLKLSDDDMAALGVRLTSARGELFEAAQERARLQAALAAAEKAALERDLSSPRGELQEMGTLTSAAVEVSASPASACPTRCEASQRAERAEASLQLLTDELHAKRVLAEQLAAEVDRAARAAQSASEKAERLAREHENCCAREAGLVAECDRVAQRCAELAVQLEAASRSELEHLRLDKAVAAVADRDFAAGEEKHQLLIRRAEMAEARAEDAEAALAAEREAHDRFRVRLGADAESREAELDAACALAERSQREAADLRVRLEAAEGAQDALEGEQQRVRPPTMVAAPEGRVKEEEQEQEPLTRLSSLESSLAKERMAHSVTAETAASLSAALTAALGKQHQAEEQFWERVAGMERDLVEERAARSLTAESTTSLSAALTEALARLDQAEKELGKRATSTAAETQLAALQERAARDKAALKMRYAAHSQQLMSEVEGVERAAVAAQASAMASRAALEKELESLHDRCGRAEAALDGQRIEATRQAELLECAVDRCAALESNLAVAGRRQISYETALAASLSALLTAAADAGFAPPRSAATPTRRPRSRSSLSLAASPASASVSDEGEADVAAGAGALEVVELVRDALLKAQARVSALQSTLAVQNDWVADLRAQRTALETQLASMVEDSDERLARVLERVAELEAELAVARADLAAAAEVQSTTSVPEPRGADADAAAAAPAAPAPAVASYDDDDDDDAAAALAECRRRCDALSASLTSAMSALASSEERLQAALEDAAAAHQGRAEAAAALDKASTAVAAAVAARHQSEDLWLIAEARTGAEPTKLVAALPDHQHHRQLRDGTVDGVLGEMDRLTAATGKLLKGPRRSAGTRLAAAEKAIHDVARLLRRDSSSLVSPLGSSPAGRRLNFASTLRVASREASRTGSPGVPRAASPAGSLLSAGGTAKRRSRGSPLASGAERETTQQLSKSQLIKSAARQHGNSGPCRGAASLSQGHGLARVCAEEREGCKENAHQLSNSAVVERSAPSRKASEEGAARSQADMFTSSTQGVAEDFAREAAAQLGEYRLAVLAACVEGDREGLAAALELAGLLPDDFAVQANFLPLHRAISGFHRHGEAGTVEALLRTLVAAGAPIDATDRAGNSALHKAIQVLDAAGVVPVVRCLLELGADGNARNGLGDTPVATELRRLRSASAQVVQLLLRAGAQADAVADGSISALALLGALTKGSPARGARRHSEPVLELLQRHEERALLLAPDRRLEQLPSATARALG